MADRGTGTRHLKLRRRHALAVLAVVALCAVPAGDALAAGKGRSASPKATRKTAVHKKPARTSASATLDLEKESVRRGWAWGQAVRGQVVTADKNGNLTTVTLQRGVVTTVGPTSLVVTSADGVAVTWTVSRTTAIVIPRAAGRSRAPQATTAPTTTSATSTTTPATSVTDTGTSDTSTTATPTTATSTTADANLTKSITAGMTVRIWGTGTGTPSARLVIADPKAPRPSRTSPTATPTSTTSTTTTSTTSTTSDPTDSTDSTDPTDTAEPGDEED